ncbi:hypothetical protein OG205_02250 [Lentzea sp. NBC_00516]|uniref:hypothetical protein n=1 Tax=Lentzea sp. NBC_00516 TaxID=2903582 RepID=UPI002E81CEF4|nr:hypothetical protein [Lentzea sp. NBC_00516]WUD25846.1 hypothetical protein OG205_02250 [Lentzea sp. NBC_00516]
MTVTFGPDHIVFAGYEFPWASVHPHSILPASAVRDASTQVGPPEIRTVSGETLFLSWDDSDGLAGFCQRHGISVAGRLDVWGNLFEPFLDTSFSAAHIAATDARLHAVGLSQSSIDSIRARLTPLMRAYNFDSMLWDWTHLGLYDLLRALNGTLVHPSLPATLGDPFEVYRWAMEIADYGRAKAS